MKREKNKTLKMVNDFKFRFQKISEKRYSILVIHSLNV